jgi:ferredoxin
VGPFCFSHRSAITESAFLHYNYFFSLRNETSSMIRSSSIVILLMAVLLGSSNAFTVHPVQPSSATQLKGWADAFKNDESLGKPQNAGLKNGPQYNENVTVNGLAVQGAVVGQKLTVVAQRARVKIPVNCQKGDCGTCVVNFNGRKVKACQTTLPAGKATIKTV